MTETSTAPPRLPPHTPPPKEPPIEQKPISQKSLTQSFSTDAALKIQGVYARLQLQNKGHYFVGMNPDQFLDKFMPWNHSTSDSYKQKVPSKARVATLRSVPPSPGQLESVMYKPFVKALDKWVTRASLRDANVPNPQTLRFLHSQQPDITCENLNVDVSTYWEDEFFNRTTFLCQQTHEEFKPGISHDAFRHESDEGPYTSQEDIADSGMDMDDNSSDEGEGDSEDEAEVLKELEEEEGEGEEEGGDEAGATAGQVNDRKLNSEDANDDFIPCLSQEDQSGVDPLPEEKDHPFIGDDAPPRSVSSGVETDTKSGIHTRGQITAYAGVALYLNFRKHFFSMLILGRYARFIRWDRRGAVVTRRFDYTRRPELIFKFYLRFGQMTPLQRGFDPTVRLYKKALPKAVRVAFEHYYHWYGGGDFTRGKRPSLDDVRFFRVEVRDSFLQYTEVFFIPAPRYSRACLFPFCRATRRSLACPYEKNKILPMCFMKDSWQEDSLRTVHEADIYRILKEEGVRNVASMRLGGDVDGLETETQNWFSTLSHNSRYSKLSKLVCHRLVLNTVARMLSTFAWCKVLLSCIADAVEGAQHAYRAGVLHRDISAGNVMIVKDKQTKQWKGILIDWDMCLLWKKHEGEARQGRTGTWAFISAKILLTPPPVKHMLWDDLESAFWVLVYHALSYMKHNLEPHPLYQAKNELFANPTYTKNGMTGGQGKRSMMRSCYMGQSAEEFAQFEVPGLTELLEELGATFHYRYDNRAQQRLPDPDLNDADEVWFPALLRKRAMEMEPLCITPTGLQSPTNDSQPPNDINEWRPASFEHAKIDFHPMRWTSNPEDATEVQNRQLERVTSSLVHHLDGDSCGSKRSHISEVQDEEDGPSNKKPRKGRI